MKKIFIGLLLFAFVFCSFQEISAQRRKTTKKRTKKPTITVQKPHPLMQQTRTDQLSMGVGNGIGSGVGRGRGTGDGIGSGTGLGTGNGTTSSQTTITQKPSKITKGVNITSKPRANYTDAARQNNVQGTISLRVTFNANGTIGSVIPTNSLPYGLTEKAVAAARGIQFEPAMKNGVAITVTSVVQYSFTIY